MPQSGDSPSGAASAGGGSAAGIDRSGTGSAGSVGSAGRGTTSEERRATIDRRLDASLGTLDREVRKEQEKTAQERDARAAASAGSSGNADAEGDGRDTDRASGTAHTEGPNGSAEGKEGRSSRPGDLKSERQRQAEGGGRSGSNSGAAQGSGATATEIPDGSDDDIVARRLRKAAEAETDPELKEKLWKEYIEYKKGAGK